MESKYRIQTCRDFDISEQQFNDCVYPSRDGCQGGWDGVSWRGGRCELLGWQQTAQLATTLLGRAH